MKNSGNHEAKRWFSQALEDYKTLDVLFKGERFYMVCFLSQQTAEKLLKAFLFSRGESIVYEHSVFKLCERASQYHDGFSDLKKSVKNLDQFYIEARYPNGLPDEIPAAFFDRSDAEKAMGMMKQVLEMVQELLLFSN